MPISAPSDGELIEQFVGGRAAAFDALVRRYETVLFGFLTRMVRDEGLADDLFQETFLRVMQALATYTEKGRFRSWLFSVARNLALDALRRRQFERRLFPSTDRDGDESESDATEGTAAPELAPDSAAARAEMSERLDRAIAGLPAEQREVLLLRYNADLTFREIAEITGDSINTVMGRMRYATTALRKKLAPFVTEDGS